MNDYTRNYLKKIREEKGISARQLSFIFNIEESAISEIERGKRNLTVEMLKKYCKYFNESADKILNISIIMNEKNSSVLPIVESHQYAGYDEDIFDSIYICPICGCRYLETFFNYCPGCGSLLSEEFKTYG